MPVLVEELPVDELVAQLGPLDRRDDPRDEHNARRSSERESESNNEPERISEVTLAGNCRTGTFRDGDGSGIVARVAARRERNASVFRRSRSRVDLSIGTGRRRGARVAGYGTVRVF